MKCPIEAHVSSVFVHVSDLKRSTEWYNRLLGIPIKPERVNGGPIYWYDLDQQTGLILDDNRHNQGEKRHPLFMFRSNDVQAAYEYIKHKGYRITKEIYQDPAISLFNFEDSEENVLMVCGPSSPQEASVPAKGADKHKNNKGPSTSPIRSRISNVFVNVRDLKRATEWYNELLQLPIKPRMENDLIYEIPMKVGATVLLDSHRHVQNEDYQTLFMFETDEINQALSYVQELHIPIFTPLESFDSVSFFSIKDPDNHVLMICQNHE